MIQNHQVMWQKDTRGKLHAVRLILTDHPAWNASCVGARSAIPQR